MACKLLMQCDLIFGILSCTLPQDTIDVDLKVCNLLGKQDDKRTEVHKSSNAALWGTEVKPLPIIEKEDGRIHEA